MTARMTMVVPTMAVWRGLDHCAALSVVLLPVATVVAVGSPVEKSSWQDLRHFDFFDFDSAKF